jgi:gamma-glutamylaminecyclotransferase
MISVFAFGTLKRGFPLHDRGLRDAKFLGTYRTRERYPLIIGGPWFAPIMLNQPGVGFQVKGELYHVSAAQLEALDALESIGIPGNFRILLDVESLTRAETTSAFAYVKTAEHAQPVHSGYIEDYQDWRFIPPWRRPSASVA